MISTYHSVWGKDSLWAHHCFSGIESVFKTLFFQSFVLQITNDSQLSWHLIYKRLPSAPCSRCTCIDDLSSPSTRCTVESTAVSSSEPVLGGVCLKENDNDLFDRKSQTSLFEIFPCFQTSEFSSVFKSGSHNFYRKICLLSNFNWLFFITTSLRHLRYSHWYKIIL